jgi:hypothetical protein
LLCIFTCKPCWAWRWLLNSITTATVSQYTQGNSGSAASKANTISHGCPNSKQSKGAGIRCHNRIPSICLEPRRNTAVPVCTRGCVLRQYNPDKGEEGREGGCHSTLFHRNI